MAKRIRKNKRIAIVSARRGNAERRAFKIMCRFFTFEIVLKGLITRRLLIEPRVIDVSKYSEANTESIMHVSKMFHMSLRNASFFRIRPLDIIFKAISIM